MNSNDPINLTRDVDVIEIPSGARSTLRADTAVRIMQHLGGSFTVTGEYGGMYRIDAADADALGLTPPPKEQTSIQSEGPLTAEMVKKELRTVFDPEIPVNIVDLGLVYGLQLFPFDEHSYKVAIKMSMTAPGCGMADVLKADVQKKIARLPNVKEVFVEVVADPPWNPGRMSEAAKLQLGFDADYGSDQSNFPIIR
jgi:probable FeS assembly SUF system protein SufT